jgi:DNA-binding FadR family transcriptional regulator
LDISILRQRSRSDILSQIVKLSLRDGLGAAVSLTPDRDLARLFGTSRVTVRQALRVLEEWGFLEARQGSGTRLRTQGSWSLAVLPALLGAVAPGSREAAALRPLAVEALALRRSFARSLPGQLAGRLAGGSLLPARRLAERAFAERHAAASFVAADAAALRVAPEAAGAPAAAWLWNDLGRAPEALARWLSGPAPVAPDYLDRQEALWDALEAGDTARAERLLGVHFARLDRGLLAAFDASAAPREER